MTLMKEERQAEIKQLRVAVWRTNTRIWEHEAQWVTLLNSKTMLQLLFKILHNTESDTEQKREGNVKLSLNKKSDKGTWMLRRINGDLEFKGELMDWFNGLNRHIRKKNKTKG